MEVCIPGYLSNCKGTQMRYLILFLFLPVLLIAQNPHTYPLFPTTADTITDYTSNDTVAVRLGMQVSGTQYWSSWNDLTKTVNDTAFITVDDKINETTVVFNVSSETWWTQTEYMQVRITGAGDVTGSVAIPLARSEGAVTIFIVPDTLLADTEVDYNKSRAVTR